MPVRHRRNITQVVDVSLYGLDQAGWVHVTLELYGGSPVTGRLFADPAQPVMFAGWLTLMALLERLVEAEPLQVPPAGLGGKLDAAAQRKLAESVGDVAVHGIAAEEQPIGDLAIGQPLGDEPHDS